MAMKSPHSFIDLGAESGDDLQTSTAALESRLAALRERRRELDGQVDHRHADGLRLDEAVLLLQLERHDQARALGAAVFTRAVDAAEWELAVQACEVIYLGDGCDALVALGHGVWLAVTFPVQPSLTVTMLRHLVDDTPDDADGAAVAAAAAAYVVDLRAESGERRDLEFIAMQMLGEVARRHGGVEEQSEFDAWAARLGLNDPDQFLVRLRNVVDVLVQDDWWIDRDRLRAELPMH